jgi:hypothetical protein
MENHSAICWAWPFKPRVGHDQNGESDHYAADDACPDFLCVGGHKAGSTRLYQQLDSHPDFWMPPVKELHYFDQLSRVERAAHLRCRDERDLQFLERLESLSVGPTIDLDKASSHKSGTIAPGSVFKKELKTCASMLGGPARDWPGRYGFSLLTFLIQLVDDFDILSWCDWVA